MKKLLFLLLLAGLGWSVQGCKTQQSPVTGDTSANSLDWEGTYEGTLPCADCEGIATSISLTRNGKFVKVYQYLGKSDREYRQEGSFEWNQAGNTITLSGIEDVPNQYLVGENQLFHLDREGKRITGDLAANYVLKKVVSKTDHPLLDAKWVLTDMEKFPDEDWNHGDIFVFLEEESNRLHGYGGCNNFFGVYELKTGNRLELGKIGRTQKYCQDEMQAENFFFAYLEQVRHYQIEGDTLELRDEGNKLVLTFTKMPGDK
ncbi:copper resistance protein NlpE N-terminal domain-containing protein [Cyclobacterium jeungdonense]|uniref:Copper resistance protein NlpE N-terminal domain-containing protein n=1 Tax=Cyclobacterium jeungdonense TaxID=708087 RepID=A0ABT8C6F8_9BACT|nr:copper resistance protein NlpE N-terminal domain-containing protein [Cyclobacterium jeungdonense]MDN3687271.1 copper resistance protein NlpE N-terminal domain-containing protein [Cyclobacterium jeungdonense]